MTARRRGDSGPRPWSALTDVGARVRRVWDRHATTSGWAAFTAASFVAFGHAGLVGGLVVWAVHLYWAPGPDVVAVGAGLTLGAAGLAWLVAGIPDLSDVYVVTQRDVPSLLAVLGMVALAAAAWRGVTVTARQDLDHSARRAGDLLRHLARPVPRAEPAAPALLQAVAVVVVVGAHTLPGGTNPSGLVERWIADVAWFAVPALVFAAGQLVARRPIPSGWTRRRLERLLVPYLLVSILAIGLRSWSAAFPPIEDPAADLLVGATFAPYHLVLTLVLLALATPSLLRLRGLPALVVLTMAVTAQAAVQVWAEPAFWRLRNPLLWLAFYLAGILVWRHRDRLGRWTTAWPGVLLAWSLTVTAVLVIPDATPARDLVTLAAAWLMVATLWMLGRSVTRLPRAAWGVARNAYLVYLVHLPFVIVVAGAAGAPAPSLRAVAGWAIGLIGATSVIVIARHLGERDPVRSLGT